MRSRHSLLRPEHLTLLPPQSSCEVQLPPLLRALKRRFQLRDYLPLSKCNFFPCMALFPPLLVLLRQHDLKEVLIDTTLHSRFPDSLLLPFIERAHVRITFPTRRLKYARDESFVRTKVHIQVSLRGSASQQSQKPEHPQPNHLFPPPSITASLPSSSSVFHAQKEDYMQKL